LADQISSPARREQSFTSLSAVDVLVIGGGIVGSGVARDLAMRGVSCAIVDQGDFASGTSSRSSRLLHGGLRYLAQGRVRLVREASTEKMTLHRIAPHLAQPLPFLFPTYKDNREWKRWQLRIGVKIYDLLCGRNLGKSEGLSSDDMLKRLPGIKATHLTGGVRYFDGFTNDARLVTDTLRSAASHGATLLNYAALESAHHHGGDAWTCVVRDKLTNQTRTITARSVVNSGGPWGDQFPASHVKLRLSKGVHLVVPRERLNVPEAVVMTQGKRILFAIPWGERTILGTTDTDYDGDRASPACSPSDAKQLLDVVNGAFPHAGLTEADVISTWSGLRPLIADPDGSPSDISREHEIHMTEPGWFDIAGGKLTTYRLMAEQLVDRIVEHLELKDVRRCTTAEEPLVSKNQTEFSAVVPPAVSKAAVEHYCTSEWAAHLDDVMIRRSSWQHYHADREDVARRACDWMAELHHWTDDHKRAEWDRYLRIARSSTQIVHGGDAGAENVERAAARETAAAAPANT
jgi:glycerol-3-phosphate dehydrogenase